MSNRCVGILPTEQCVVRYIERRPGDPENHYWQVNYFMGDHGWKRRKTFEGKADALAFVKEEGLVNVG